MQQSGGESVGALRTLSVEKEAMPSRDNDPDILEMDAAEWQREVAEKKSKKTHSTSKLLLTGQHTPETTEGIPSENRVEKKQVDEKRRKKWQPIVQPNGPTIYPVGHWETDIFVESDLGLCTLWVNNGPIFSDAS